MKQIIAIILAILLLLPLVACGKSAEPTWQEQYDLGVRYLSDGNYEEAIIAFTVAIEIDPKREEAYVGLADVYYATGDTAKAEEILAQMVELGDNEMESLGDLEISLDDNDKLVHRSNGEKHVYEYDDAGTLVRLERYDVDGLRRDCHSFEYDDSGRLIREENGYWRYHYDGVTGELLQTMWEPIGWCSYYYEDGNIVRYEEFDAEGQLYERSVCNFIYSDDGKIVKAETDDFHYRYDYDSFGNISRIEIYYAYEDETGEKVTLQTIELLYYSGKRLEKIEVYEPPFWGDSDVLITEYFFDEKGRVSLRNYYDDRLEKEIYLDHYSVYEYSTDSITVYEYDDDGSQTGRKVHKFDSMGMIESTYSEWASEEEIEHYDNAFYNNYYHMSYYMSGFMRYYDAIYDSISSLAFYFNSGSALTYWDDGIIVF